MKTRAIIFLSFFLAACLLLPFFSVYFNCQPSSAQLKPPTIEEASSIPTAVEVNADQAIAEPFPESSSEAFQAGHESTSAPCLRAASSFSRHLMCKDHTFPGYDPIDPTTTFTPSDKKAECLTTVWITSSIEFRWYYRSNSSNAWVSCYNDTESVCSLASNGGCYYAGYLSIAGCWPGVFFPRAYKVDVYLDNVLSFSEFFEVTNGGLDSPRMCEGVDASGQAVNVKSLFTTSDTQICHYLRFDDMAYFNEETGKSHNFTTVWVQPDGATYSTQSWLFNDYKDNDTNSNCWKYGLISQDSIPIDSSTPVGNWEVEVYVDNYFVNDSWVSYGPIAVTPFIVGNQSVAKWTIMAYLDSDNSLANASIGSQVHDLGIDVFLEMANVTSSPDVNVIVELGRGPSLDERYGNWTGGKRFNVEKGLTPTAENAVQDLGDVDMGDPNTLRDFVNWSMYNYPADHFFLVLWDHGSGCMGTCEDVTHGSYLTLPDITSALSGMPAILDAVLIDACSMGMVEVAYQLKDVANILIGPEGLGYAPAPYDSYLNSLSANSSISPIDFSKDIVTDYERWCLANAAEIQNATMTAIDLTQMTSLSAAIDNFASTLIEKETSGHTEIDSARNIAKGYPGPYSYANGTYQTGYYIDLYNFTWQTYRSAADESLKNSCGEVMAALDNAVISKIDISDPGTNGLAVFFPDEKPEYDSFSTIYEHTAFAENTLWTEFIRNHVSGFFLTVKAQYTDTPVEALPFIVDGDFYETTSEGQISLFLQPGPHEVNATTIYSSAVDSQSVFLQWMDSSTLANRTFTIMNADLTVAVEYILQYRLVIQTNFGGTDPTQGVYWYNASSSVSITAIPPNAGAGENYTGLVWVQTGHQNFTGNNPINFFMDEPTNVTAVWKHEYFLSVSSEHGTTTPTSGWYEAGIAMDGSITSPVSESTDTQYISTGWTGKGSVPSEGTSTATPNFTLDGPSDIVWNWKTQYLLTVHTDPNGLSPQPTIYPLGSWYDNGSQVNCTAQQISGCVFQQWSSGGSNWEVGVNPITITMDGPYELTAHYVQAQAWWQVLGRPDVMQTLLAILGTVVTFGLVGGTWLRSRKRRDVVKMFIAEIDDVYSRFKTDPKKCEEELYALRNTILQGFTEGKISEDNYDILDNRIDKYVNELSKK